MLTSNQVLDQYYLEARCMLLEIAATLDRYDRAAAVDANGRAGQDERLQKLYDSLKFLAQPSATPDRSEQLLNLFSDLD
jgi:hypothetical protein